MSNADLEARLRSYYGRYRPDDSTTLVLAARTHLDEIRSRPARGFWSARGIAAGLVVAVLAVVMAAGGLLVVLGGLPASQAGPSGAASASAPASAVAGTISKSQAAAALKDFVGHDIGSVTVEGPSPWGGGRAYEIMGTVPNPISGRVDAVTGKVVSLMLSVPETTTVNLTPAQAEAAASAFFKAHDIPVEGLTATVKLEDHGCCKLYSVEWVRVENGARTPDSRLAQVDPSNGTVFSFSIFSEPYGPVASPSIGRDQAITLATAAGGLTKPKLEAAELLIVSGSAYAGTGWSGRLVWSIQLSDDSKGYVSAVWVYVDGVTGETMIAGRG